MKLAFTDFWDGFLPQNNFFLHLFKDIFGDVQLTSPEESDVLIYSCFGRQEHHKFNPNSKTKIYYTGENLRPNFNECTYSFTFDYNDYGGKNVRIPLWLLQIDWYNQKDYGNPKYVIPLDKIHQNDWIKKPKDKFCCAVFNNADDRRTTAVRKFRGYKFVNTFGKPFGNWFYGEDKKYDTISDYKFNICFENAIYPGYYTEKLIHAKCAGSIPVYYADKNSSLDFNPKSFINLFDYENIKELLQKVIEVDKSEELTQEYQNELLFTTSPEQVFEDIKFDVERMLS